MRPFVLSLMPCHAHFSALLWLLMRGTSDHIRDMVMPGPACVALFLQLKGFGFHSESSSAIV